MAEWSKAAVLKTVDLHGSGGSNPSLSAKKTKQGDVDLSTSFCFCSTTHANLFVGCSDVKTKVVDLSTPCVVLILQGARRRGKGKTSSACATKSIPYSVTQLFTLLLFFASIEEFVQSVAFRATCLRVAVVCCRKSLSDDCL